MNTTNLRDAFQSILKNAGLPTSFRVYDLRHTAATFLGLAKVSVRTIADRLGHSTTRLTLDTYSHVLPSMSDEAAEVMEQVLHSGHILDAKTPKKAQSHSKKRR